MPGYCSGMAVNYRGKFFIAFGQGNRTVTADIGNPLVCFDTSKVTAVNVLHCWPMVLQWNGFKMP
jgi:hypothetical protein